MKKILYLLTAGIMAFALTACSTPLKETGGVQSAAPSVTAEAAEPTETAMPTASTEPTGTQMPAPTATPTATSQPTTPSAKPTNEPTRTSSSPAKTPKPTATPKSTATAKPATTPNPTTVPTAALEPTPPPTPVPTATPVPTQAPEPEMEVLGGGFNSAVLSAVNQARADNGLEPLSLSGSLCKKALAHAKEMAVQGKIFHSCGGAESVSNSSGSGNSIGTRSAAHATGLALDADRSRLGVGSVKYNGKQYACVFSPRD